MGAGSLAPGPGNYSSKNDVIMTKAPGYSILGGKIENNKGLEKSNQPGPGQYVYNINSNKENFG